MAIGPDTVHRGQGEDLSGVFTLTAERGSVPWHCIDGNRPVGEGLTGRGVEHPPPLLLCQPLNGIPRRESITPTSRPGYFRKRVWNLSMEP